MGNTERRRAPTRVRRGPPRRLPTLTGLQGRFIQSGLRRRGFQRHRFELGVGQIAAWTGGVGPSVVLLHGFGASSEWQWARQMGALVKHHRVIVPDLLFFGESTSNRASPGLALQVEALGQLLDRLDVTQTDLIGCSYGGFVAQAFASKSPERVRRLVLGDSPGSIFERTDYDYILDRYGIESLDELLLPATSADVRRLLELAWHTPPRIPGFLLADARRALYFAHLDEKRALLTDLVSHMGGGHPLPAALWPRTLLVWGAHDAIFPVVLAERVQRAWSGARLVVIPKAGHAPQIERPRLFNDTVQRFISGPVSA